MTVVGHGAAVLVMNPTAAGGRTVAALPAVRRRLDALGVGHRVVAARDAEHARLATREAVAADELPVGFGGDGTVALVAAETARSRGARFAMLPAGRGNDLARALGIPRDPLAACDLLAAGVPTPIDLGEIETADGARTPFLGVASLGFDSDANAIANRAPRPLAPVAYVWGAVGALTRMRPRTFHLELDGVPVVHRGLTVALASSRCYGGGMWIAPDARLDDGRLDVVLIRQVGAAGDPAGVPDGPLPRRTPLAARGRFLRLLPRVFDGSHIAVAAVEVHRAREVRVRVDAPAPGLYADGELVCAPPARVRARAAALEVLLPGGDPPPVLGGPARDGVR